MLQFPAGGRGRLRVGVTCLMLAACMLTVGCDQAATALPPEVLGRWRTQEPRYADRFVELSEDTIRIGTGGTMATSHPIRAVRSEPHPSGTLYTIEYGNEGNEATFAFYFEAAQRVLRLRSRPGFAWSLEGTGDG